MQKFDRLFGNSVNAIELETTGKIETVKISNDHLVRSYAVVCSV